MCEEKKIDISINEFEQKGRHGSQRPNTFFVNLFYGANMTFKYISRWTVSRGNAWPSAPRTGSGLAPAWPRVAVATRGLGGPSPVPAPSPSLRRTALRGSGSPYHRGRGPGPLCPQQQGSPGQCIAHKWQKSTSIFLCFCIQTLCLENEKLESDAKMLS